MTFIIVKRKTFINGTLFLKRLGIVDLFICFYLNCRLFEDLHGGEKIVMIRIAIFTLVSSTVKFIQIFFVKLLETCEKLICWYLCE